MAVKNARSLVHKHERLDSGVVLSAGGYIWSSQRGLWTPFLDLFESTQMLDLCSYGENERESIIGCRHL